MEKILKIDKEKCINCNLCNKTCILTKFCGYEKIEDGAQKFCINCGHCIAICPTGAINHYKIKSVEKIGELPNFEMTKNLIMKTRSVRDFTGEKLKDTEIESFRKIMEYSASGINLQSIELMIIQDEQQLKNITKITMQMYNLIEKIYKFPFIKNIIKFAGGKNNFESLKFEVNTHKQRKIAYQNGADPILYNAPALLLFIAPDKSALATDDSTIISQNILLASSALNLGGCYMGCITVGCKLLKYKPLIKALKIPKGYFLSQALVIGHPSFQLANMPERNHKNINLI